MYVKRLVGAAATAAGVGLSALTFGAGARQRRPVGPAPAMPDLPTGSGRSDDWASDDRATG